MNAATNGVSGNSHQGADTEGIAYEKFINALEAGEVCIANRAPPFISTLLRW